jgi:hypothetical protein
MEPLGRLAKMGAHLIPLAPERGGKMGGMVTLYDEDCAVAASCGFGDSRQLEGQIGRVRRYLEKGDGGLRRWRHSRTGAVRHWWLLGMGGRRPTRAR